MAAKRLYVLDLGYVDASKASVSGGDLKDRSQMIQMPIQAFLIETDDGWILYDTGAHPDAMKGYWPDYLQKLFPFHQTEKQRLENQLALCGVKPEDIHTVVLSHMHLDHMGGIYLFPDADVYVPKEDFTYALLKTHLTAAGTGHGGYIRADLERPVKQYHLVSEDFELVPGVSVLTLPGHTPGLLGVMVQLRDQTIILPQDAIYAEANFGPPAKESGVSYHQKEFFASIEKVRTLAEKYDAKVYFAHDSEQFKTLLKAPYYYE